MANRGTRAKPTPNRVTPLWIVAAFVTLTEAVLGIAVTQVTGGVQIALTGFVIVFALLVSGAFFFILWNRPYVFYSPAEYGGTDPKHFVDAMRGIVPDQIVERVRDAEAKPKDDSAQFALMDSLIDEAVRQHLLLMHDKKVKIPITDYWGGRFETGKGDGSWMSGTISGREIAKRLGGSGLVTIEPSGPSVQLTDMGDRFAAWLAINGRRNDFYTSHLGGWGTPKRPDAWPGELFHGMGVPPDQKQQSRNHPSQPPLDIQPNGAGAVKGGVAAPAANEPAAGAFGTASVLQNDNDPPGTTGDPQHNDPESIARWIAAADAIPPVQMTPEEEADWQAARAEQKRLDTESHDRLAASLPGADG